MKSSYGLKKKAIEFDFSSSKASPLDISGFRMLH
jgi:hypothetical protein